MRTSELQGAALDWAVMQCEEFVEDVFEPSEYWGDGGPIIERENIEIKKGNPLYFPQGNEKDDYYEDLWIAGKMHGPTPLIAAMRCYVAMKLGDEVEVPDELLQGEQA
jgi:hypothetical protein